MGSEKSNARLYYRMSIAMTIVAMLVLWLVMAAVSLSRSWRFVAYIPLWAAMVWMWINTAKDWRTRL